MSIAHPKSGSGREPTELAPMPGAAPRPSQNVSEPARRSSAARPSIQLHIEELVLHGFSPHDRHHIAEAVETELHRLLEAQGLAAAQFQDLTMERLDAGEFTAAPGASAGSLGAQMAQSVYRASTAGITSRSGNQATGSGR